MNSHNLNYSAEADPLVPAEKLSTNRTVLYSNGTVVPPDCSLKAIINILIFKKIKNLPSQEQFYYFDVFHKTEQLDHEFAPNCQVLEAT